MSGGTYSLKSTPNDNRFFEKLFMAVFIYFQNFCQKSAERKEILFVFCFDVWPKGPGLYPDFTFNKPTHYVLNYGGFWYIHTYIIGHYNPSVRIIDLVSYTTYVVCVKLIHKWRDLLFKADSERQIFWETFHGNFIYSQSFCQKSAERKSPKKYFLYFVFMSGLGLELWLYV